MAPNTSSNEETRLQYDMRTVRHLLGRVRTATMTNLREFRTFVLRGNVVDLAVGIVIGAAFQGVVQGFVNDILTPLIALPTNKRFQDWVIPLGSNKNQILIGDFLNKFISFVIIAAVVFFFVVRPLNLLITLSNRFMPKETLQRECPYCMNMISAKATRCGFCTSEVEPPPPSPPVELPVSYFDPRRIRIRDPRQHQQDTSL